MTSDQVRAFVDDQLAQWRPPTVEAGSTIGVPWDEQRYRAEIDVLRAALVMPTQQLFRLAETYEHISAPDKPTATYWIVAVTDGTILWYDETTGEFGLGETEPEPSLPTSLGVRGDLVGSFCAR